MTSDAFRAIVISAATDSEAADLLVSMLVEFVEAKRMLRAAGYGCAGLGLLDTTREVLAATTCTHP